MEKKPADKSPCPDCNGTGKCPTCDGFGCMSCDYSGNCDRCLGLNHGHDRTDRNEPGTCRRFQAHRDAGSIPARSTYKVSHMTQGRSR
jgi:hypothetical protein